jgi:hypothetical protein
MALSWLNLPCALKAAIGTGKRTLGDPHQSAAPQGPQQGLGITPDGFPLGYEVLPGNTRDDATLRSFLQKIEAQYGKAERIWVMDCGIPTEGVLAEMRRADPPVYYLVGTPKGRLAKLEKALLKLPWQAVREGVDVKLLPKDADLSCEKRCSHPQGTRHPPPEIAMAVGAAERHLENGTQARRSAHETRRRTSQGARRLASR